MMLNADIISEELSKLTTVRRSGQFSEKLTLGRPRFYESHKNWEVGYVYITRQDNLPAQPPQPPHPSPSLLIFVGGDAPAAWNNSNLPLLTIGATADLIKIFNVVQMLFDRYARWDEQMRHILEGESNIEQMVLLSAPLFDNTITVIDKNLHLLARSSPYMAEDGTRKWKSYDNDSIIPPNDAALMKDLYWGYRARKEPYLHDDDKRYGGTWVYSINLFVSDCYEGTASLSAVFHPFRPGEQALFRHFTDYIHKLLEKKLLSLNCDSGSLSMVIKDLLEFFPVDERRLDHAKNSFDRGATVDQYRCMRLQPMGFLQPLPADYLSASINKLLPRSFAMPYDNGVVVLMHDVPHQASPDSPTLSYLKKMDLKMGVSNPFCDFHKFRIYYSQACCALEIGTVISPQDDIYLFEKQALPYLISVCRRGFAPEDLLPSGLVALAKLNSQSSVDFWQTLKVYLDNEMNAAQTAKDLYLHRSTLQQRLKRINSVTGNAPSDAAERLYYRICFYMIEQYGGLDKI